MFLRMETFYINIFFYSLVDPVCGESDVKIGDETVLEESNGERRGDVDVTTRSQCIKVLPINSFRLTF